MQAPMSAAATIHLHRFIIRTNHPTFKIYALVDAYNAATDPAALHTDREHRALRRFARVTLAALRRPEYTGQWQENENGQANVIRTPPQ